MSEQIDVSSGGIQKEGEPRNDVREIVEETTTSGSLNVSSKESDDVEGEICPEVCNIKEDEAKTFDIEEGKTEEQKESTDSDVAAATNSVDTVKSDNETNRERGDSPDHIESLNKKESKESRKSKIQNTNLKTDTKTKVYEDEEKVFDKNPDVPEDSTNVSTEGSHEQIGTCSKSEVVLEESHINSEVASEGGEIGTDKTNEVTLKEHEPLTQLLSQIPKKAQRGIFGQTCDLILTCLDANRDYIAVGSNVGLLFLYNRREETVERFKCSSSNEIITCVKLQHGMDHQLAFGTSKGVIYMFQLPSNMIGHKKLLQKFEVKDVHKCMVTTLDWSANGMKMFSGDIKGHVIFTTVDFYEGQCQSEILLVENQEIIQLNYAYKILLISTKCRSVICRMDDRRQLVQIGQKERKLLGNFGACFVTGCYKTADAEIYAARPGLRLWRANIEGIVKLTFNFKDIIDRPSNSELKILPLQRHKFKTNSEPQILQLLMFGDDKVVSWNDHSLYIFDPGGNNMYGVQHHLGLIKSVAVHENEIFVLQGSCDRAVIRIASEPDTRGSKYKYQRHSEDNTVSESRMSATGMTTSQTKDSLFTSSIFGKLKTKNDKDTPIKQLLSKTAAFIDKNVISSDSEKYGTENSETPQAVMSEELQRVNQEKIIDKESLPPVIHLASPDLVKIEIFENDVKSVTEVAPSVGDSENPTQPTHEIKEQINSEFETSGSSVSNFGAATVNDRQILRTTSHSSDLTDSVCSTDGAAERFMDSLPSLRDISNTDTSNIVFDAKLKKVKKKKKAGKHSTPTASPNPGNKFIQKPVTLNTDSTDSKENVSKTSLSVDEKDSLKRIEPLSTELPSLTEKESLNLTVTESNTQTAEDSTHSSESSTRFDVCETISGKNVTESRDSSCIDAGRHESINGVNSEVVSDVSLSETQSVSKTTCVPAVSSSESNQTDQGASVRPKRMNPFNKPEFSLNPSHNERLPENKSENTSLDSVKQVPLKSPDYISGRTVGSHKKLNRRTSFEESVDFYSKYSPQSPSPLSASHPVNSSDHPLYRSQMSRDSSDMSLPLDASLTQSLLGEERCNIWTEFLAPGNLNSLCLSEKHVWVCDKSENIHYSALGGTTLVWRKAAGQASQIASSHSGSIVWRLHKNTVYAATKIIPKRPEGLKWVEIVRDVSCMALDESTAWYIETTGQVMMQRGLTKDQPFSRTYEVDDHPSLKSIICSNGVVWGLTNTFQAVCRVGIKKTCPQGTEWALVDNEGEKLLFNTIALGVDNIGWGIDVLGYIWFCTGVTKDNPNGDGKWWQVPISEYLIQDVTSLEILKNLAHKFDPQKLTQLLGVQRGGLISVSRSGVWICLEQKNILHVCKGNIEGHKWEEAQPIGIASSTIWKSVTAEGADFDYGYVWAQQPNGEIFVFPSATREFRTVQPPSSKLFCCMTATKDSVWGLTMEGNVYIRDGMGPHCPEGTQWAMLDLTQLGDAHFVYISCGMLNVWAVDMEGVVYQRIGVRAPTRDGLNPVWLPVDANPSGGEFMQVISGPFDWMVWAVDNRRQVYVRVGISDVMPIGTEWVHVPGTPALQLTASSKHVYAVNLNREVLCRYGISADNPAGDYWKKVPGIVSHITASPMDKLWAVNREGQLWSRDTNYLHQKVQGSPQTSPLQRTLSIGSEDGDWELV